MRRVEDLRSQIQYWVSSQISQYRTRVNRGSQDQHLFHVRYARMVRVEDRVGLDPRLEGSLDIWQLDTCRFRSAPALC